MITNDVDQAARKIYASVADRLTCSYDEFADLIHDWIIIPIYQQRSVIGGIMVKGNELHIGSERPSYGARTYLKVIQDTLDQYGTAVTSIMKTNLPGIKFCERLGFQITGVTRDRYVLTMRECKICSKRST